MVALESEVVVIGTDDPWAKYAAKNVVAAPAAESKPPVAHQGTPPATSASATVEVNDLTFHYPDIGITRVARTHAQCVVFCCHCVLMSTWPTSRLFLRSAHTHTPHVLVLSINLMLYIMLLTVPCVICCAVKGAKQMHGQIQNKYVDTVHAATCFVH
jgi:hypothetical protein